MMKTAVTVAALALGVGAARGDSPPDRRVPCEGEVKLIAGEAMGMFMVNMLSTTHAVGGYEFKIAAYDAANNVLRKVDFTTGLAQYPNAPLNFDVALSGSMVLGTSLTGQSVSAGILLRAPIEMQMIPSGSELCIVNDDHLVFATTADPESTALCPVNGEFNGHSAICPDLPLVEPATPVCDTSTCALYDGRSAKCNSMKNTEGCLYVPSTDKCMCTYDPPVCQDAVCSMYHGGRCEAAMYGGPFGCQWSRTSKTCSCSA